MLDSEIDKCMEILAGYWSMSDTTPDEIRLWRKQFARVDLADALAAMEDAKLNARFSTVKFPDIFDRIRQRRIAAGIESREYQRHQKLLMAHGKSPDQYGAAETWIRYYHALWLKCGKRESYRNQLSQACRMALGSDGYEDEWAKQASECIYDDGHLFYEQLAYLVESSKQPAEPAGVES